MRRPISRAFRSGAIAALLLTACGGAALRASAHTQAAPLASDPNTLVVARDISDGKTMDPGRSYEFTSAAVIENTYDELVTYTGSETDTPKPALATSWKISKNARVFFFHLRKGVRFSNGDPMTAADVVFSYKRLANLADNPSFLVTEDTNGKPVTNQIRALGKYTVEFILSTPDVSFLAALADVNFGVLDEKVVKAHGGNDSVNATKTDKATTWLNNHSIGTGPFVLTKWTRGASGQIVLVRNKYYWGPKPHVNKIIFQGIQNSTTQRLEVAKGTVDIAQNVDVDGVAALKGNPSVTIKTGATLNLVYMGMTTSCSLSKELCNPKVRQAIREAIDYNGIITGLLRGVGTQPNSMIPVGMLGNDKAFNASVKPKYDPTAAKALLKSAGYPNGFSVTLQYDGGTTYDGVNYDLLAPLVAHDLAGVGIQVKLSPQQDTVLLPAYRAQKVPFILYNWGVDFPDPNDYAGPFGSGGGPATRMLYTFDAHQAALAKQADAISNAAQRANLYHQIQRIWLNEGPWVGLVQPNGIVVLHKGVTGYTYNAEYDSNFRLVKKTG